LSREELHALKIPFYLLSGEPKIAVPEFVNKYKIGGVVTDFSPLRVPMKWAEEVGKKLTSDDDEDDSVPLCQVDAHNIVPVWVASDKQEYAARTIRPKIDRLLATYLTEFPSVISHPHIGKIDFEDIANPFEVL
jgi:deoxyribodipyrimidine photo-lyase